MAEGTIGERQIKIYQRLKLLFRRVIKRVVAAESVSLIPRLKIHLSDAGVNPQRLGTRGGKSGPFRHLSDEAARACSERVAAGIGFIESSIFLAD